MIRFLLCLLLLIVANVHAQDVTESLAPGVNVVFEVAADGSPAPTFEWFRNGTKIGEGARLEVGPFDATKAGTYTVKASNPAGSATSDKYTLLLATPPSKPTIKLVLTVTATATATIGGTPSSATPGTP